MAFARARRRSGRVRLLRKAIPVSVLATVVAMVVTAIFNPFAPSSGRSLYRALAQRHQGHDGESEARGFRSDGQPYSATARESAPGVKSPTTVELRNLTGDVGMAGGETMRMSANSGIYDTLAQRMRLSGNVPISNTRFDVRLRTADIDFKTGPIGVDDPSKSIWASNDGFQGPRFGSQQWQGTDLEGHVRTRMNSPPDTTADADAKEPRP